MPLRVGGQALYERQLHWLAHRRDESGSGKTGQCGCHVLAIVRISQGHYLRSLNVAEPCSPHFDPRIHSQSNVAHFRSDVLPFSIAVGPDVEDIGIPGLGLNVLRYSLLVLPWSVLVCQSTNLSRSTVQMLSRFQWEHRKGLMDDTNAISCSGPEILE
jgi:hypothetical protein